MTVPALQRLVTQLEAAVSGPGAALPRRVTAALKAAVSESEWLPADRRRASQDNYARHVLHGDAAGRFSILSIVWNPGQMSSIHAHHTWCAVAVYRGTLVETFFRTDAPAAAPVAVRTTTRAAHTLSFERPLAAIHRVANETSEPAISIHVYGVGRDRIASGVNRIYQAA